MNMDPTKLAELQNYFDHTDLSAEIEESTLDDTVDPAPMVGITVRLPAAVLNKVREQAGVRGIKATALIREWVEASVAEDADDDSTVKVSEVKKLLAHATRERAQGGASRNEALTTIEHPKQRITIDGQIAVIEGLRFVASDVSASNLRRHWERSGLTDWQQMLTHSRDMERK